MQRLTLLLWLAGAANLIVASRLPAQQPAQQSGQPRCESIQLRFVNETPPKGAHRYRERSTGKSYVLTDTVALDARGIEDVYLEPFKDVRDTVWTVVANVRPAFAPAMSALVAAHLDGHMGILIGNELIQTALIAGPVRSKAPLRIMTSKPIADSLARRARAAIAPRCSDR